MTPPKTSRSMLATQMVGAKTLVMDCPPDMTMVLGPENLVLSDSIRATRIAPSQTPSVMTTSVFRPSNDKLCSGPPLVRIPCAPPPPPPGKRRTRMVDLKDALVRAPLPPLPSARSMLPIAKDPTRTPRPPLSPPPGSAVSGPSWLHQLSDRRWLLLIVASVFLLLIFMVPLVSGESGKGLAEAQPQTPTPTAEPLPAHTAPISRERPALAPGQVTQAQAGALLLSGRRREALAVYQQLAETSDSDAGIAAMIVVLEQKVDTP